MSDGWTDESRARRVLEVVNERGLHARAATKLVHLASGFDAEVSLQKDEQRANAKSVMGVLLLCGARGTRLAVEARGRDAEAAVEAIEALFAEGFGEEP